MLNNLRDKFNAWYRDYKYRRGKFYEIYSDDKLYENESHVAAFKLLKGKYKDVVFSIGTIKVGETLPDGSAKATFDVDVIQQPSKFKRDLTLDAAFNKITSDIVLVVLEDAIKSADERMKSLEQELRGADNEFDEDRTDYIEEPVQKRAVRKKNPSVSKKRVLSRKS